MENASLRVTHAVSFPQNSQLLLSQPGFQDLNRKIISFIDQIGDKIVQNLQAYQCQEIIDYKEDLLKTQQQFYKLRHQRDQQSIKAGIISHKQKMQAQFNQKVKASELGVNLYQKMKIQLKQMSEKQKQLKKEIQYMRRHLKKTKLQGQSLDQQINYFEQQKKNKTKAKLFNDKNNTIQQIQPKQASYEKSNLRQKDQARIIAKIEQIKDYMKQIPQQLNYYQMKISQILDQQSGIVRQKFKRTYLEQILNEEQTKIYVYQTYFQDQN